MKNIKIKCPAKINLTLEILNKREDGFHNIKSIMQMISLFDILDIRLSKGSGEILLSGNSNEIPYNEKNLVYKAVRMFFDTLEINNFDTEIYIDKKIPISAGLAGGSTDGAGTLFGLNTLFNSPLSEKELHILCAKLGSDLNVCLEGGCVLATSRGEKTQKLKPAKCDVTLIKPRNLGISAKEAYTKYSLKTEKPHFDMTEKMLSALEEGKKDIKSFLYNDLEYAVFNDYEELQKIKKLIPNSIMSGSGSTYFVLENLNNLNLGPEYQVIPNLRFIEEGVSLISF